MSDSMKNDPEDFPVAKPPGSFPTAKAPAKPRKQTEARRLRQTQRWRKLSESLRREQSFCVDPLGIHEMRKSPKPSTCVHHIIGIEEQPELAFSRANLAALCQSCHNELERLERAGESTKHLFKAGADQGER